MANPIEPLAPVGVATPVTQAVAAALQPAGAPASAASHDAFGTKLFADMLRGVEPARHGAHGMPALQGSGPAGGVGELLQQMSELQSTADPIKAQYVMLDVFGQRMEALSRLHITVALGSGATNVFKQLFNRHD